MDTEPTLLAWVTSVEAALGTGAVTDIPTVLDLVRDVAHQVERPAGPLAAYLVGVAVGSGRMELAEATAAVERLLGTRAAEG